MNKLIVLCMNEIPVGVYNTIDGAHEAKLAHEEKEGIRFPYQLRIFELNAAAKR